MDRRGSLRVALAIVVVIAGWALVAYAGYRHRSPSPESTRGGHAVRRGALAVGGIALAVLEVGFLRSAI
jgi:hypothetical protein